MPRLDSLFVPITHVSGTDPYLLSFVLPEAAVISGVFVQAFRDDGNSWASYDLFPLLRTGFGQPVSGSIPPLKLIPTSVMSYGVDLTSFELASGRYFLKVPHELDGAPQLYHGLSVYYLVLDKT